jgi:TonB family protein
MVRLTLPARKALTSTAKARDRAARTLLPRDPCDAHARRIVLALACASLAAAQAPSTEPPATTKSTPASTPATGPTAADAPPSTTTVPLGIARADAYAEFRRLYDLKEFDAAAKQGQRVVALIESDPSATSDELQVALMNLAAAQSFAQDYIGAEATYQRVIGLLETEGKVGSSRMARATAGLAGVYSSEKRYELAVPAYERALTMSRRAEGLFNEEQLPLLDGYAESLTEMGNYQQALQAYSYGLRVAERRFGAESQQIVERLEEVGRWYTRIGAYDPGRQALRAAVRIVEKKQGPNAIELVGPLTAIAESFRRQLLDPVAMRENHDSDRNSVFHDATNMPMQSHVPGLLAAEGERALTRAVQIVDAQPHPSPLQVADVRTQMGDWYQTRLQNDRALPHYKVAWEAATHAPDVAGKSLRELLFGRPVLLHYVRSSEWDRYAKRPPTEVSARSVEVELTVSDEGRVRGRKLVSNEGDAHMGEEALEAADTARYRPRFEDGVPVETSDVRLVQVYYVPVEPSPADADASKTGSATTTDAPPKADGAAQPPATPKTEAPASVQQPATPEPAPTPETTSNTAPGTAPESTP